VLSKGIKLREVPGHYEEALTEVYGKSEIRSLGWGNVASVYSVDAHSLEKAIAVKIRSKFTSGYKASTPRTYDVRDESFRNDLEKQRFLNERLNAVQKERVWVGYNIREVLVPVGKSNDNFFAVNWIEIPFNPKALSLSSLLEHGPLDVGTLRFVFHDLLTALSHCHEVGVMHGDIDSSNMMFGEGQRTSLIDFGLSRHIGKETAIDINGGKNSKHFIAWGAYDRTAPELQDAALAHAGCDVYGFGNFAKKHSPANHRPLRGIDEAVDKNPSCRPSVEELLASVKEW
jgi:serine/threonine protein kinase